jgi:hypothetical protein
MTHTLEAKLIKEAQDIEIGDFIAFGWSILQVVKIEQEDAETLRFFTRMSGVEATAPKTMPLAIFN